jgi:hypothetical protein
MSLQLSGWARLWIAFALLVWGLDVWFGWSAWTSEPIPHAGFRAILAFLVFSIALIPLLVAAIFAIGKVVLRAAQGGG